MKTYELVQKLWNLCLVLRDDGITYHQYVTELTYLLFLKLLKETGQEHNLPVCYRWEQVAAKPVEEVKEFYNQLLKDLGQSSHSLIQQIYVQAVSLIQEPQNLYKLIKAIDELDWYSAKVEGLGDLYEGILAKNASEKKSGAGQYFSPRALITVMVKLINPRQGERCHDPAAGTFGFMIACDRHVRSFTNNYQNLSATEAQYQQTEAFTGCELVPDTHRLALMNAMLHGINSEILLGDSLAERVGNPVLYDVILTNPPFGAKKGGMRNIRTDLPYPSTNKQLNFLQQIYLSLKPNGRSRAAVIVPDNVLFQNADGQKVRIDLMEKCNVHTILRLPKGIFYAPGVHTSVLFFTRGSADQGNTKEIWFYDMRTDMPVFGKKVALSEHDFADFIQAYQATDRCLVQDVRWSCYSRGQIRDNQDNLDMGLRTSEEMSFAADHPESLAAEAIAKLQLATQHLQELLTELQGKSGRGTR